MAVQPALVALVPIDTMTACCELLPKSARIAYTAVACGIHWKRRHLCRRLLGARQRACPPRACFVCLKALLVALKPFGRTLQPQNGVVARFRLVGCRSRHPHLGGIGAVALIPGRLWSGKSRLPSFYERFERCPSKTSNASIGQYKTWASMRRTRSHITVYQWRTIGPTLNSGTMARIRLWPGKKQEIGSHLIIGH